MNEKELLKRIDGLEKRIEKLEKALAGGAKPKADKVPEDYEQIIKSKDTSAHYYYLTNKGRVLQYSSSLTPSRWNSDKQYNEAQYSDETKSKLKPEWLTRFKSNLLAIGEQYLLKGESVEALLDCVAALRAKYHTKAGLPCLLPNMSGVWESGSVSAFTESTKSIKFK